MATGIIYSTLTDGSGTPLVGVTVTARLAPIGTGFRADNTECIGFEETVTDASGDYQFTLEINDDIVIPTGTFWIIHEKVNTDTAHGGFQWPVEVAAGTHSVAASLVDPTASTGMSNYLTQAVGDLRYQPLGTFNFPFFFPEDYGTIGAGDDTAAILAAHTAADANGGGTVWFNADTEYSCASLFDLSSSSGVTWESTSGPQGAVTIVYTGDGSSRSFAGAGAITSGLTALTVAGGDFTNADIDSTITIDGAGANGTPLQAKITAVGGPTAVTIQGAASTTVAAADVKVGRSFIKLPNSNSNQFRNIRIEYSDPDFFGCLIDFYSPTGSFSAYNELYNVRLSGRDATAIDAACLLNLSTALRSIVTSCYFAYADRAAASRNDYNHINFCRTANLNDAAYWNFRQACSFNGCVATPCADGTMQFYDYDNTDSIKIISFNDIWTGDGVADTGTIIRFKGRFIEINGGCQLTTGDTAVELVGGEAGATAVINGYLGCPNGIQFTLGGATKWKACTGSPYITGGTADIVNPGNCSTLRLVVTGDSNPSLPKDIGPWIQNNVAATQTGVALTLLDGVRASLPMVRPGSVTGIVVTSNEARTAGTCTVEVTIGGVATGLTAVLNAADTTTAVSRQSPYLDTYAEGALIGVTVTTPGTWTPVTADITVIVEVAE